MRIVIDMQGAQSNSSRHRGIGRYTLALAQAMARVGRGHEFILALNGRFTDATEDIWHRFKGLVEPANFRIWMPPLHEDLQSVGARVVSERLYEAFLVSLKPDAVHILSLFEGLGEGVVTSIGAFARLPTAVTLYDLIPYIHAQPYLDNPVVREWYLRKLFLLRRADMWLAISESSRQEGIQYLGLDAGRCINVSTAADETFRVMDMPAAEADAIRERYSLRKPFVMYTGGIDPRKNIEGLFEAFARLPEDLRDTHQLAIVCSIHAKDRERLIGLASGLGLRPESIVMSGFVPDQDLVRLYNLCRLFVFPSWHEGFGLPALEAMHCGAVVLGANTSSVPEVIGRADALFDPRSPDEMAALMVRGLRDDGYRASLRAHGLEQAQRFSWDESARRTLAGLENLHASGVAPFRPAMGAGRRPRMAYVSPLPPQRSGIAGYSAKLLPYLASHYDIDLITDLPSVDDPALEASFNKRSVAWFRKNFARYDRVLYHIGNSAMHAGMFELLAKIPGVVVLHDFFLGDVLAHMESEGRDTTVWVRALYESHGYVAATNRLRANGVSEQLLAYPANFTVLQNAQGVVVHSSYAIELARRWYAPRVSQDWQTVPLARGARQPDAAERASAREALGLRPDDFVVCSFGLLGANKLNLELIQAWRTSPLIHSPRCHLIFVGENDSGSYGQRVVQAIGGARIELTGWASQDQFRQYLSAADLAVQLRTRSRGESSAAALEVMGHGVALIVNAHGSMAELPSDRVCMLADKFTESDLRDALVELWRDSKVRARLATDGRQFVAQVHDPALSAHGYANAVEAFAASGVFCRDRLIASVGDDIASAELDIAGARMPALAQAIADSLPAVSAQRRLFVDVSELARTDAGTGIQRVVKGLLRELLTAPPPGFRIEPVAAVPGQVGYRYARHFTLGFLQCQAVDVLDDAPIDACGGDVFVGLDLEPRVVCEQREYYRRLRQSGVRVEFVVYDLLPILLPHRFMRGADELHQRWLEIVSESDGAVCISRAVADELTTWLATQAFGRTALARGFAVHAFHLGVDSPGHGASKPVPRPRKGLPAPRERPTFLMVGTLEPRKGHGLVLEAFDQVWANHVDANLLIVGRPGWLNQALVKQLREHPKLGTRLFWIQDADDAEVEALYAASDCLIAASEGEGFGLPLIEAAQHGLPVLARDIPVFREVGGAYAKYFRSSPEDLAQAINAQIQVLGTRQERGMSVVSGLSHLTWKDSAREFLAALRV